MIPLLLYDARERRERKRVFLIDFGYAEICDGKPLTRECVHCECHYSNLDHIDSMEERLDKVYNRPPEPVDSGNYNRRNSNGATIPSTAFPGSFEFPLGYFDLPDDVK